MQNQLQHSYFCFLLLSKLKNKKFIHGFYFSTFHNRLHGFSCFNHKHIEPKWLIDYLNIFKPPIPFVLLFHFTNSTKVLSTSIIIFCSNTSRKGKVGSNMLDKSQDLKGNNREVFVTCLNKLHTFFMNFFAKKTNLSIKLDDYCKGNMLKRNTFHQHLIVNKIQSSHN